MSRKVTHTASSLATRLHRRTPSAAMLVAGVALSVALAGTASAALDLSKGDALISKHSLSGNRLKEVTRSQARRSESTRWEGSERADRRPRTTRRQCRRRPARLSADTAGHATAADNATPTRTLRTRRTDCPRFIG